MSKLEVRYVLTAELIPYARNSRTHSDEQVAQIAGSIKEFGFTNPILVDEENGIIAGHGRLRAASILKLSEVPTICLTGLTKAQKKAYVIADNKLALNAGWDTKLLSIELKDLETLDFDLSLLGFDGSELEALLNPEVDPTEGLTDADAVPENFETRCKPGDLWKLGEHRLLCGDSTNVQHIERLMGGEKADMVFTDPPYGMSLDTDYRTANGPGGYRGKDMNRSQGLKHSRIAGDHDDFSPELIATIFACFSDCPEIFIFGADYFAEHIPDRKHGSWIVWDKVTKADGEQSGVERFHGSNFELCWSKAKHKRDLARIMHKGFTSIENERRVHPTQKPVALTEWFIERWGKKTKNLVDLFLGSGSTLIACEKTKRRCYGMELDPKYCDVILTRWEQFTGKTAELADA